MRNVDWLWLARGWFNSGSGRLADRQPATTGQANSSPPTPRLAAGKLPRLKLLGHIDQPGLPEWSYNVSWHYTRGVAPADMRSVSAPWCCCPWGLISSGARQRQSKQGEGQEECGLLSYVEETTAHWSEYKLLF
jgi:hypothetical protein